jgi:hypothetical protein
MPLFGHSRGEDKDDHSTGSPDFDALLAHFNQLPLPERAAEMLTGISSQLSAGERSAMDRLLTPWLGEQYTAEDRPDSWYTLKYLLAETFQALELSRMVFRIDETPQGDMMSYYAVSSDGRAALERGDVAEVIQRRLPD